jgi:uncharacterized protein YegP (UPF0339 family)
MRKVMRSVVLPLVLVGTIATLGLELSAAQDKGKDKGKPAATATFELYKDKAGEFRFRFKDGEGNLLASSGKGYETKADCQKVIDAIKREAARAKVDDQAK